MHEIFYELDGDYNFDIKLIFKGDIKYIDYFYNAIVEAVSAFEDQSCQYCSLIDWIKENFYQDDMLDLIKTIEMVKR